jgi:signal transduction histidine kinase
MSDIRILIVEDEAIVAEDISSCLERIGYQVVGVVSTGENALLTAARTQPDLVLMDIMLQGDMDGIQATHLIRTNLQLPVVYLTANADEHTLERAKITGPFGYILKPFKERELRAAIEIALSRHQAEVEVKKALAQAQTERLQAQESNALKSQYLSMASHEFRTPLSVIKMAAEILQNYSHQLSEEKRQQSIQRICAATDSMNQLLEDVLTLGRADSGKLEFTPTLIELVSFCQDLLETLQVSAGDCYILKLISSRSSIWAMLDEKLMWHLLNNLLSNAIKYSPNGGTISLTLSQQENNIYIQIRDQGIGIPPEYLKCLFEPFQRAKNVGKIQGTGLGLAIVKRSVDLHGGQIDVNSEVGRGSTFTVILPFQP